MRYTRLYQKLYQFFQKIPKHAAVCVTILAALFLTSCGQRTGSGHAAAPEETKKPTVISYFPRRDPDAQVETPSPLSSYNPLGPLETPDVENNGGYFVRVEQRIYFRKYGKRALETTALSGAFLTQPDRTTADTSEGVLSDLMYYDLTTGAVETAFSERGYGGLCYCAGGFCLQEVVDGQDMVVWYSLDGQQRREICDGAILGVSEYGNLLAVERHDWQGGDDDILTIYRGETPVASVQSGTELYSYAGITEDHLFYVSYNYTTEERQLWQLTAGGGPVCLGALPAAESMVSGEVAQCVTADDIVAVLVGYYQGTGHYLTGYTALWARIDEAGSLGVLYSGGVSDDSGELPKLVQDGQGGFMTAANQYGDLALRTGANGAVDLVLYDGWAFGTLRAGLTPAPENGKGFRYIVQSMEYVSGCAYVILARTHAAPLNAVGWRDAWRILEMQYLVIPANSREMELTYMDYEAVLRGKLWFINDPMGNYHQALWQQTGARGAESTVALLEELSPNAVYVSHSAGTAQTGSLSDLLGIIGTDTWLAPDALGEADYLGYPVPWGAAFPALFRLDRNGQMIWITEDSTG